MHHRIQAPHQHVDVRHAAFGVLVQKLRDDRFQLRRQVGDMIPHRLGIHEPLHLQHFRQRRRLQRRPAGQQGIQHAPQAIQIGAMIDGVPRGLFGRHVFGGPQHAPGGGQPVLAEESRDPEVGQLHLPILA